MIKDWNRGELEIGEVFHFKNSLTPFTCIHNTRGESLFLDIDENIAYDFDEIQECEYFNFYEIEEDEDFCGVMVDGKIDWIA